jgi:hypothetical protein
MTRERVERLLMWGLVGVVFGCGLILVVIQFFK